MPALSNPRHERFAQELAKGETADAAYVAAGYAENRGNAIRLKANERVASRIAEIQERVAQRAEWTAADRLETLAKIVSANAATDPRVAVSAIAEANKMQGSHAPVKSEVGAPGDFDRMDDADLARFIAAEASALGCRDKGASSPSGKAGLRGEPKRVH